MATTARVNLGDFVTHHDQGGVYEVFGHGAAESMRVDVYLMASKGTPRKVRGRVNADGSLTLSGWSSDPAKVAQERARLAELELRLDEANARAVATGGRVR